MLKLKVWNTSPAAKFTSTKVQKFRIKDGIKFLYMKKQKNELWLLPYALTGVQRMEE